MSRLPASTSHYEVGVQVFPYLETYRLLDTPNLQKKSK